MRSTRLLHRTLFDDPADAEIASHRLLARGGFIRKVATGVYAYSPLMWRTLRKISQIVREEMDRAGGQELMLPIIQPLEFWESSGRKDAYLKAGIMFHLEDRRGAQMCLGPTHEEIITDFVQGTIESYRQLPVTAYQIQNKYRDEFRPRFGLMRCREFIMKDAYSFDVDEKGLAGSYEAMREAYSRIFDRCGLSYVIVEADSGAIGGADSEEFMVTASAGEDELLTCSECGYGANVERAESVLPEGVSGGDPETMHLEETPGVTSVEALEKFCSLSPTRMVKTVLFEAAFADKDETIAVLVRGDREVNRVKVQNTLGALDLEIASDETVTSVTGAAPGFAGPVGLEGVRIFADRSIEGMTNFLCGANQTDHHLLDVNFGRDVNVAEFFDLATAGDGDRCTRCDGGVLKSLRGIEVGHVFKLGTKYSQAMDATFSDRDGSRQAYWMGCYGIGVSRIAAASVEQNHDEKGIVWPIPLAPFEVVVVPMKMDDPSVVQAAEKLYVELQQAGIEVLLDDREGRPGGKLKDSELMGFPYRVICGRSLADGQVEIERRGDGQKDMVALPEATAWLAERLKMACDGESALAES